MDRMHRDAEQWLFEANCVLKSLGEQISRMCICLAFGFIVFWCTWYVVIQTWPLNPLGFFQPDLWLDVILQAVMVGVDVILLYWAWRSCRNIRDLRRELRSLHQQVAERLDRALVR